MGSNFNGEAISMEQTNICKSAMCCEDWREEEGHIVGRQIIFAANVAFAVIWLSLVYYILYLSRTNYLSIPRQTFLLKT